MEDERFQLGATVGRTAEEQDEEEGFECTSSPYRRDSYRDAVPEDITAEACSFSSPSGTATTDEATFVSEVTFTEHGTVSATDVHSPPAIAIAPENVSVVDEPLVKNMQQVIMT